ncbi:hypothetical protein AAVH_13928, partial [Aphelenchoides avenae]
AVEVHYDKSWYLSFELIDHDAHRAKCEELGIRQVQFFENEILTAPREVPLGIQRIVALLEKAPSTYGLGRALSMGSLFAAYRNKFDEDISEPEKLCSVFALREDDANRILQTCQNVCMLEYGHFESTVNHARPRVFEMKQASVCLPSDYKGANMEPYSVPHWYVTAWCTDQKMRRLRAGLVANGTEYGPLLQPCR